MQLKKAEALDKEWMKKARDLGLLNEKHFKQALEAYNEQISIAEKLREDIKERGVTIIQPVGKDRERSEPNKSVSLLQTTEKLAQSLRKELDDKVEKAMIQLEKDKENDIKL